MPATFHQTAPAPVKLRINLYANNGGYEVELLDISADAPPVEEQRRGVSKARFKRAKRIFMTDVTVFEVVPHVGEIDDATVKPIDDATVKP
jgi:hypothetical protein